MTKKNTPLVSALKAVKKKLNKKTWIKRSYFSEKDGNLCMCVHGAGQSEVNPEVKIALKLDIAGAARRAADADRDGASARAAATAFSAFSGLGMTTWNNRPSWIKDDFIYDNKNYGNLDLHYLMGMVGLTVEFNDSEDTALPMIKKRLDKAIQLATQLGI